MPLRTRQLLERTNARRKGLWILISIGVFALLIFSYAAITRKKASALSSPDKPPVIIVFVSGLRTDKVPSKFRHIQEPEFDESHLDPDHLVLKNIGEFASHSDSFLSTVTVSTYTRTAVASTLTGSYPQTHGTDPRIDLEATISSDLVTLAEILKSRGYRTAAFMNQDGLTPALGIDRGYDRFDVFGDTWLDRENNRIGRSAEETTNSALEWIQAGRDQPFHLMVHFNDASPDVHSPTVYEVDPAWLKKCRLEPLKPIAHNGLSGLNLISKLEQGGRGLPMPLTESLKRGYLASLLKVDHEFGRVMNQLKELGVYDSSLIILTTERGEAFGADGQYCHQSLHRESTQIPLLIKYPNQLECKPCRGLAQHVDILPTITEVLGDDSYDTRLGGEALRAFHFTGMVKRPWAFTIGAKRNVCLQTVFRKLTFGPDLKPRLYNKELDPYERNDLAPKNVQTTYHFISQLKKLDYDLQTKFETPFSLDVQWLE